MSGVLIKKNFLYLFIFIEIINNQVEWVRHVYQYVVPVVRRLKVNRHDCISQLDVTFMYFTWNYSLPCESLN